MKSQVKYQVYLFFDFVVILCLLCVDVEIIFDGVAGMEAFKIWKSNNDPQQNRKMLLTRWLFIHDFFTAQIYPPVVRYVPLHLEEEVAMEEEYEDSVEES